MLSFQHETWRVNVTIGILIRAMVSKTQYDNFDLGQKVSARLEM